MMKKALITLLLIPVLQACANSGVQSDSLNNYSSISTSELVSVEWSCGTKNTDSILRNDDYLKYVYGKLVARMFQTGLDRSYVVCQLGVPTIHRKAEKYIEPLGIAMNEGEQLLFYGDTNSSYRNNLVLLSNPEGVVRTIAWLRPNDRIWQGLHLNQLTGHYDLLNGNYTLGRDADILQSL